MIMDQGTQALCRLSNLMATEPRSEIPMNWSALGQPLLHTPIRRARLRGSVAGQERLGAIYGHV